MGQPPGRNLAASDTLSGNIVRALLGEAVRRGLPEADLRRRFAIPDEVMDDVDARIAAGLLVRIWNELPILLGDDDFGLHGRPKDTREHTRIFHCPMEFDADQSAFHKAFARWTGTTPGAFRKGTAGR